MQRFWVYRPHHMHANITLTGSGCSRRGIRPKSGVMKFGAAMLCDQESSSCDEYLPGIS